MSLSSIFAYIKKYPLLILIITASVILAIIFAIQKSDSEEKTPSSEISLSSNESTELNQPSTFATDINGNKVKSSSVTTAPNEQNSTDVVFFSMNTTEPTDPPVSSTFTTVKDDYFHDALFIGNSRTVGLSLYGSMPEETTFYATVGMNIYDLMTSTAQVPPETGAEQSFSSLLNSKQFGKVYIMLGINDLGTGTSESFAEYYKGVIDKIHEAQPNAIIYIQSIINISAERDSQGDVISNSNINEKNALLEKLANNDYIFYLNINEVLIDSNGFLNADYTSDGIHLGGGSLSLWEDYLYSHAIVR